ncbi:MAG: type IV pilus biogenesis/stability protein PilW [Arenimonas sp.]
MRRLELALVLLVVAGCSTGGHDRPGKASKGLSEDGSMNLGLGQGLLQANDIKRASERARMALASDPGSADVHALMAMIHARNGLNDKATHEFDRALKLAPSNPSILNAHAAWLCEHGHYTQADAEFTRALRDPAFAWRQQGLSNAGRCAHLARHWSQAEAYLRKALELEPEDGPVLLLLADSELQQGQILEAQAFIQRRDSLGSDAQTLELAARIEEAANSPLGAARYRQRLHDEFPDHVPAAQGARTP